MSFVSGSSLKLAMFAALVIHLIVVQYLVIAGQDNTTGLDTTALIGATKNNSSLTDTARHQGSPIEGHWVDYVDFETEKQDVVIIPDLPVTFTFEFFSILPDHFPAVPTKENDSAGKPFKIHGLDYIHHKTIGQDIVISSDHPTKTPNENDAQDTVSKPVNNKTSRVGTEENMNVDNNETKTKDKVGSSAIVGESFPVGTEASKEKEMISIDIPDSKSNNSRNIGTNENSMIHNNRTKAKDLGFNENILMAHNTVNVILSLCCIALSFLMIYSRMRENSTRSIVHILFLQNGFADFFVGIGVLSQSPVLYLMIWKGRDISGITVPVFISYFVTSVAVKMSVFLNCVLGVVRCINIVNPFYRPNKKVLAASTLLYMIIWMFIIGLDLWQFADKRGFKNQVFLVKTFLLKGQPGSGLILLTMKKEEEAMSFLAHHLGNLIQFIIPTALPTLLCFVLMIVQLYHMPNKSLSKTTTATKDSQNKDGTMSKARMTIFLLTCIYVITSGVSIVTWLVVHGLRGYLGSKKEFESLMKEGRTATSWSDLTAIYFSLSTCHLICSTLTPLTLLLRGTGPVLSRMRSVFNKSKNRRERSTARKTLTSAA